MLVCGWRCVGGASAGLKFGGVLAGLPHNVAGCGACRFVIEEGCRNEQIEHISIR